MRTGLVWASLGGIDLRNVARDSMLRWMILLTPGLGLLVRAGLPPMGEVLHARLGFDLTPYHSLVISFLPLAAAGMIGAVVGFLLLDQRDDHTMSALLVTPLTLADYLRYRLGALVLASIALTCITIPLAGRETTTVQLGVTAVVAAPLAPVYALFLGSFAANKVQGFALAKAIGLVLVPCIAAYFVDAPWQYAFGAIPHYWPLKVFWLFDEGRTGAGLVHAVVGLGWQSIVVALLARRFARVVRR
jgi:fluoroquinolone transport system permease protein